MYITNGTKQINPINETTNKSPAAKVESVNNGCIINKRIRPRNNTLAANSSPNPLVNPSAVRLSSRIPPAIQNTEMIISAIRTPVSELGSAAWTMGWLHGKLALVLLLTVLHEMMGRWRRQFAQDDNQHSQTFFRVVNEAPTLLMIGIVILAILKPF